MVCLSGRTEQKQEDSVSNEMRRGKRRVIRQLWRPNEAWGRYERHVLVIRGRPARPGTQQLRYAGN